MKYGFMPWCVMLLFNLSSYGAEPAEVLPEIESSEALSVEDGCNEIGNNVSSKFGVLMELIGDSKPIVGFQPEEACGLLVKSIDHVGGKAHKNNGRLLYLVSQKSSMFRGSQSYHITLAERRGEGYRAIDAFIVCLNGTIYKQGKIKDGVSDYQIASSIPKIPLNADVELLSDKLDGELAYDKAFKILIVKVFTFDKEVRLNGMNLSYLYQGIMEYQGSYYYNFSLCENYSTDKFKVLSDYLVDGRGSILKGIQTNNSIVWTVMPGS